MAVTIQDGFPDQNRIKTGILFLHLLHDTGVKIYGCKATVDMFHLTKDDFCPQVDDIISVGQFYEMSAGANIIFT